ncbi:hypothetical protein MP638_006282 [Amoeboaphelidium occidentale]|nr:hypothetical protein MP638_006282 [Amoeboaphelidium occidentale]
MKFSLISFALLIASAAAFDVRQENLDQKKQYCLSNQYTCSTTCAGAAKENTCDPETLKWFCQCQNGNPTLSKFAFPIEVAQCEGELLDCVNDCLRTTNPDNNFCTAKCKNEKKCGTVQSTQKTVFQTAPAPPSQPQSNSAFTITNNLGPLAVSAIVAAMII